MVLLLELWGTSKVKSYIICYYVQEALYPLDLAF